MATWKISNEQKKSCEEKELWYNEDKDWNIVRITGFRWGTFIVETSDDEQPEGIDAENSEGINMYDYFGDNAENGAELDSMDDGWFEDWQWDEAMTEEDREEILALWEEESYSGFENNGWYNSETEAWLHGPLSIERID